MMQQIRTSYSERLAEFKKKRAERLEEQKRRKSFVPPLSGFDGVETKGFGPLVSSQRQEKVAVALSTYGFSVEGINVVEHPDKKSYMAARNRADATNSNKISAWIIKMLYNLLPVAGGFCDTERATMNVQISTGTVIRLHEMVHGHDLIKTNLAPQAKENIEWEKTISLRRPLDYIRYKLDEIRLVAILEGRAKFCEGMASKDSYFDRTDRFRFGISRVGEAVLFVLGTYQVYDAVFSLFQRYPNPLTYGFLGLATILGTWVSYRLAPYVQGLWFMEKIEQKLVDPKEVLRVTAEYPPTLGEIFWPRSYLRRIENEVYY